jgi:hypothetical protein
MKALRHANVLSVGRVRSRSGALSAAVRARGALVRVIKNRLGARLDACPRFPGVQTLGARSCRLPFGSVRRKADPLRVNIVLLLAVFGCSLRLCYLIVTYDEKH